MIGGAADDGEVPGDVAALGSAVDSNGRIATMRLNVGVDDWTEPLIWTLKYGTGRVFQTALGHDVKAMQSPGFTVTLGRGAEWAGTGRVTIPVPADLK